MLEIVTTAKPRGGVGHSRQSIEYGQLRYQNHIEESLARIRMDGDSSVDVRDLLQHRKNDGLGVPMKLLEGIRSAL